MADVVDDDEILELAIMREIDANRLYLAIAARVEDAGLRKVLEELAAEELEHKAKLELEVMKSGRVVVATGQEDDDEQLMGQPELPEAQINMNYRELLLMAIQKEQTSFRLYVELAGRVSDANSKEILLALAEEEVKHKQRFEYEYDRILKEG